MANNSTPLPQKRWELKKNQAIVVLVIGVILFAQTFFISAEVGSSAHTMKNAIAIIGIAIFIAGLCLRPVKETPQKSK